MAVPCCISLISISIFLGKSVCVKCCEYILLQVVKNWFSDVYVFGCEFVWGFGLCVGDDADSIYLSIIVTVTGYVDVGRLCMGDGFLYVVLFRLV